MSDSFGQNRPTSWWPFVNSPFGLWLLGSIALTLITWSFGALTSYTSSRGERNRLETKIYAELTIRFEAAQYEVTISDRSHGRVQVSPEELARSAQIALENINGKRSIGFPEFRDVPATALMSQLAVLEGPGGTGRKMLQSWIPWEVRFRDQADPAMQHSISKPTTEELYAELGSIWASLRKATPR